MCTTSAAYRDCYVFQSTHSCHPDCVWGCSLPAAVKKNFFIETSEIPFHFFFQTLKWAHMCDAAEDIQPCAQKEFEGTERHTAERISPAQTISVITRTEDRSGPG